MSSMNQVNEIDLPEIHLVGLCITSPFNSHRPDRIEAMKNEFLRRKGEIQHVLHPERYVSPHFSSEILFTYFVCMEVARLSDIPEGMLGFTIPPHRYAAVQSPDDPYRVIHDYLQATSKHNHDKALALEIYRFDKSVWPDEAEVYIPLREAAQ
ncbi:GyrI-like domain-containing protein [Paenibacillus aurantiacus]|uniref:GyrI-like domain-containing protein n=1 Tax=Paenibacillus aurantiacus TaxID=1936118 RepID=A0ABV5KUP2_9BACL